MPRERLRKTLSELRRELHQTDAADPDARERVREAAEELDAWLEGADAPEESLTERLNEAVAQFESEHPNLASTVRRVIDALADLGI